MIWFLLYALVSMGMASLFTYKTVRQEGVMKGGDIRDAALLAVFWPILAVGLIVCAGPLIAASKAAKLHEADELKAKNLAAMKAEEDKLFAIAEGKTKTGPAPARRVHAVDCPCRVCDPWEEEEDEDE